MDRRAARRGPASEGRVGRYLIQGEIATGGMATVHIGRLVGTAGFSRDVAIKRLHPQFAKSPDFVNMFLDEARLASRVLHPNVVPILDVVAEAGELFLVMELVAGESLSKLVRASPEGLPLSLTSAIAVGMLEGLHAAHEARGEHGEPLGIVHRDVSPQNVLVGVDGVARLIDFGVAKASGNATMTRDGEIKGKIAYMAPEQIAATKLDRRADIYSASVVLWEMVTGRRYFGEVESDVALMLRAMTSAPTPPSSVRPEIPAALDALVLRGLAHDREQRFASAREMAQAIERIAAPAAARDVARWVEAKAGASVRGLTQQLSHFDASVATALPGKPSIPIEQPPRAAREDVVAAAPSAPPAPSAPSAPPASPAAASKSEPPASVSPPPVAPAAVEAEPPLAVAPPASSPQPSSRRPIYTAAAIAIALALGFFAARIFDRNADNAATVTSGSVSTTEPDVKPSAAIAVASERPMLPPSQSAAASPSAILPSSKPSSRPSSTLKPTSAATTGARVPSARPPATANCNPPYVITADGVRQYKPECLK